MIARPDAPIDLDIDHGVAQTDCVQGRPATISEGARASAGIGNRHGRERALEPREVPIEVARPSATHLITS